jgi:hypothetical protein
MRMSVKFTGSWGKEPTARLYCLCFCFVFFGSIRGNSVAICRVDGTRRQRPCCVWTSLRCFLTFPLCQPTVWYNIAAASTNRESMTVPLLEGPEYISSPGFELGLRGPEPEPERKWNRHRSVDRRSCLPFSWHLKGRQHFADRASGEVKILK